MSRQSRRRQERRRPWPLRLLQLVLATVIAVSTLALAGVVFGHVTQQFRLAPVLSGSMGPGIPTGSLVEAEPIPTRDLKPGDILLFNAPIDGHPLVMHRVFDETVHKGGSTFHTKGDANDAPDAWTIRVKDPVSWTVRRHVPFVGTAIGWVSKIGARMFVLVGGTLLLLLWGLSAVWAKPTISWRANDPKQVIPDRHRRRTNRRAVVVAACGSVIVSTLATAGLAGAQFTSTPTPPVPGLGSGALGAPSSAACSWTNTTQLNLTWGDPTPTFTTAYNVQRSNTSGSGYASIATPSPESTHTYTDSPPVPVTTQRYYVVDSTHGTWSSSHSSQLPSGLCIRAINNNAGTGTAGFSGDNGQATSAQITDPNDIAVDASGNVFIADTTNNRIRRVDGSTGVITTIAGGGATAGCAFAGAATSAILSAPRGVAVDGSGNVYISDTGNSCIRKVSGGNISLYAGTGANTACNYTGAATTVSLSAPRGLDVDSSGNVYITDTTRRCVRKVVAGTVSQVAGAGAGTASACTFAGAATAVILNTTASDVAVDASGNVYIADTGSNCIRKVASGNVSQYAGGGATTTCTSTVAATAFSLSGPTGVAIDSSGRLVIADTGRRCVQMVSSGNISQVAGTGTSGSTGDGGPAVAALMNTPSCVGANASGNLWVGDSVIDRVRQIKGPV